MGLSLSSLKIGPKDPPKTVLVPPLFERDIKCVCVGALAKQEPTHADPRASITLRPGQQQGSGSASQRLEKGLESSCFAG